MKPAALANTLDELVTATKKGNVNWQVEFQSTDSLDDTEKPTIVEDGTEWIVDECFVSFYCRYHGTDHLMITYEHIKKHGQQVHSDNLIFVPPLSVRYFDVGILSPYIVDANAVLLDKFHNLWTMLLELQKAGDEHVTMKVFDPYE